MRFRICTLLVFVVPAIAAGQNSPKRLSLAEAVHASLENNVSVQFARETELQSRARIQERKSALLPQLDGFVGYTSQTISLAAQGIQIPGVPLPDRVGPFGVTDVRAQVSQPLLDVSLLRRYQAAKRSAASSESDTQAARQNAAAMVSRLYYDVQRTAALVESAQAQIKLDEELRNLARNRQGAGTGTGLEIARAESRLAEDNYRFLQVQSEHKTAEYELLRAMGERLEISLELTDSLIAEPIVPESLQTAIDSALRNRPEIRASEERLTASRISRDAARAEQLPSVHGFANYGPIRSGGSFAPTDAAGVQLKLPLFDSGRQRAHRSLAASQEREESIRARDIRDQVEMEVRIAHDKLSSIREQLASAQKALQLANSELDLARLRFENEVTTQLDVVTAQTALAAARSREVNSLAALRSAEIEWKRARGVPF